jgi:tetratricopeptide (TPR) repeat protein
MTIWSNEIKDLQKLYDSFKGKYPKLDKELEKLIKTDDENMVLIYARRCLEVIITDLCERELKRPRGTEPLKGIIDKLNKEEKVPHNIIVSMQNLNSLSTFGAHPKDFDPRQVKPVVLDLTTIIDWYIKYAETLETGEVKPETVKEKKKVTVSYRKEPSKIRKRIILISGILLVCAVVVVGLVVFDIIGGGKHARASSIESVLILPFGNYTGDKTLEPLLSGMHSSLISEMGRLSGLRVISKTSSDAFKDASMTVHEIASKMNVGAVIEPSVLCWGDTICMGLAMISGDPEEKQLWIGDYKEEKSQILNLYNRITKKIANEVKIKLTPQEEILLTESKIVNTEAYDAYLMGQFYLDQVDQDPLLKAREYFNKAIEIDPDWAPPYAGLAEVGAYQMQMHFVTPSIVIPKIYENLNKALDLDPNSANSHYVKAVIAVWTEWNWEKGEKEFLKALELNPGNALCRIFYAHLLMILRRSDEALYQANLALKLDPLRPFVLGLYAVVMREAGNYHSAIQHAEKALSIDPDHRFAKSHLAGAYSDIGEYKKWFERWKEVAIMDDWDDEIIASIDTIFQENGYSATIKKLIMINEEAFTKGNNISFIGQGNRYCIVKEYDKAIDYFEKAYEIHDPNMPYLSTRLYYHDQLKDNPRYLALLKKMNLPVE